MKQYLSQVVSSLGDLNQAHLNCAVGNLGIRFSAAGPDFLCAEMPVDERTIQPYGILHGGSSLLLAESLGSAASWFLVKDGGGLALGIDCNGSHVKSVQSGWVTGICRPLRIGKSVHFWNVEVQDEAGHLLCQARLTVKIIWPGPEQAGD